MEQKGLIAFSF